MVTLQNCHMRLLLVQSSVTTVEQMPMPIGELEQSAWRFGCSDVVKATKGRETTHGLATHREYKVLPHVSSLLSCCVSPT